MEFCFCLSSFVPCPQQEGCSELPAVVKLFPSTPHLWGSLTGHLLVGWGSTCLTKPYPWPGCGASLCAQLPLWGPEPETLARALHRGSLSQPEGGHSRPRWGGEHRQATGYQPCTLLSPSFLLFLLTPSFVQESLWLPSQEHHQCYATCFLPLPTA